MSRFPRWGPRLFLAVFSVLFLYFLFFILSVAPPLRGVEDQRSKLKGVGLLPPEKMKIRTHARTRFERDDLEDSFLGMCPLKKSSARWSVHTETRQSGQHMALQ